VRVTKETRGQVQSYYTLTDELQVQLQVLSERGAVKPKVQSTTVDGDISALAFIVIMQASKSAQDDLKGIMEKVKAINSQKKKLRDLIKDKHVGNLDFEATFQVMAVGIDAVVDQMKNDLDSMSEMGEMESLRLQMAMDRLSKMMSTLSNLLKKISDTASQITQNLK
jgi:hypothetical protein